MKMYKYTVIVELDEGAYHAYLPALRGCHTFGETREAALRHLSEAVQLHLEGLITNGQPIPIEADELLVTELAVPV